MHGCLGIIPPRDKALQHLDAHISANYTRTQVPDTDRPPPNTVARSSSYNILFACGATMDLWPNGVFLIYRTQPFLFDNFSFFLSLFFFSFSFEIDSQGRPTSRNTLFTSSIIFISNTEASFCQSCIEVMFKRTAVFFLLTLIYLYIIVNNFRE